MVDNTKTLGGQVTDLLPSLSTLLDLQQLA
jgi:hypothetical protein